MKLFSAIKIPPHLASQIERLQKGVSGARWSEPDKLHITLAYYGEVDDAHAEVLDSELARRPFSSFELSLGAAGHFGKSEPHAIWLSVNASDALIELHKHTKFAARRAGITVETRNYKPHVTLAYLKRGAPIERIIAFEKLRADFNCKPFLVDEFFLFSSHQKAKGHNSYHIEASYPLLGNLR